MENALQFLRIQNFKSIKDVTLHPRRVNLLIGEPNVGKSNLLEAMTLLGSITYEPTDRFLGSFIRYEELRQLFYDNLVGNTHAHANRWAQPGGYCELAAFVAEVMATGSRLWQR